MHQSRRWGHYLGQTGGSDATTVQKLGKTLRDSRAFSEMALRRTALEALVPAAAIGSSEALALQTDALGDPSAPIRAMSIQTLRKAAGGKRAEVGSAVALALQEAIPHRRTTWDNNARTSCAEAIQQLVPRGDATAVQLARKWLKDDSPAVRCAAVQALGEVGKGAKDVEVVGAMLRDPQWQVKSAAIQALVRLGSLDAPPVMLMPSTPPSADKKKRQLQKRATTRTPGPARSSVASSNNSNPRRGSVGSMASPKAEARSRRNSVTSVSSVSSSNKSPPARINKLAKTMSRIPESDKDRAVVQLAQALEDADLRGFVRAEAVNAIGILCEGGIGYAANMLATEATSASLGDPDAAVQQAAVRALNALAPNDNIATIRAAAGALNHPDWRSRGAASEVLSSVAAEGLTQVIESYNAVTVNLEAETWAGRRGVPMAMRRLAEIGTQDNFDKVLAVLIPRLDHSDWSIRRKAAQALVEALKSQGGTNHAVRFVKGYLKDPEEEVRKVLAMALPFAAPTKSKAAVTLAGQLCEDPDPEVRLEGLAALRGLASVDRSRSRRAIAICIKCIQSDDDDLRASAVQTMKVIADGRRTAIDGLTEVFANPNEKVHLAAGQAFAAVGRARFPRAQRRVVKLLRDPDHVVRKAAMAAMALLAGGDEAEMLTAEQVEDVASDPVIAAAAQAVGRFRRRFQGPRGALLSPVSDAGSRMPSKQSALGGLTANNLGQMSMGLEKSGLPPRDISDAASGRDDEAETQSVMSFRSNRPREGSKKPKPTSRRKSALTVAPPGGGRRGSVTRPPNPQAGILQALMRGDNMADALSEAEMERRRLYLEENSEDEEEDLSESGTDVDDILDLPEDLIAASLRQVR